MKTRNWSSCCCWTPGGALLWQVFIVLSEPASISPWLRSTGTSFTFSSAKRLFVLLDSTPIIHYSIDYHTDGTHSPIYSYLINEMLWFLFVVYVSIKLLQIDSNVLHHNLRNIRGSRNPATLLWRKCKDTVCTVQNKDKDIFFVLHVLHFFIVMKIGMGMNR